MAILRVTGWERFQWLRAGFTTRMGGVSSIYGEGELNLGMTREDDAEAVRQNRELALRQVGGDALAVMRQVHGTRVVPVEAGGPAGDADGLVTSTPGVLLGVQAADCVPVLVADTRLRVVGAFHAGWRGTAAGIVEVGLARMREEFGCGMEDLIAAVGPSIGMCCYAVGSEVREIFADESLFQERGGETFLDLWEANRRQLVRAGMASERISILGECTACSRKEGRRKFFSHRAEDGVTGRGMGLIGVI